MGLTQFPFTLRSPDGQEYQITVPARTRSEAEQSLKAVLSSLHYRDKIITPGDISVKDPGLPFARPAIKRNYHLFNWADKNTIYKNKEH